MLLAVLAFLRFLNRISLIYIIEQTFHIFCNCVSSCCSYFKPATHLAILYADRRDRQKSPGVPSAAIAIFVDRRDRRIKSPLSGILDIGE